METGYFGDDKQSSVELQNFMEKPVTVIAQAKENTKENIERNFGMPISGRIPKSAASDETGREVSASGHLFCGYTGSFLRNRGRRTWTGRGNCPKSL